MRRLDETKSSGLVWKRHGFKGALGFAHYGRTPNQAFFVCSLAYMPFRAHAKAGQYATRERVSSDLQRVHTGHVESGRRKLQHSGRPFRGVLRSEEQTSD